MAIATSTKALRECNLIFEHHIYIIHYTRHQSDKKGKEKTMPRIDKHTGTVFLSIRLLAESFFTRKSLMVKTMNEE